MWGRQDVVNRNATVPRLLEDGETVLVITGSCCPYRVDGLAGIEPSAQFVYDFGYRNCAVPTVAGHYWVQTDMSGHSITSLDISDTSHPI